MTTSEEFFRLEYRRLCDDIRGIELSQQRLMTVAILILYGASYLASMSNRDPSIAGFIFLTVPLALLSVIAFVVQSYAGVFALAGYKEHLERAMNKVVGQNILIWERIMTSAGQRSSYAIIYWTVTGTFGVYLAAFCFYKSLGLVAFWVWAVSIILTIGFGLSIFFIGKEVFCKVKRDTLEIAYKIQMDIIPP